MDARGGMTVAMDFASAYDENYAKVFNYVQYRVMNRTETEDIVSEVFMKALRHYQSYDEHRASVATWLFAIARNAVNDHFNRTKRRTLLPIEAAEQVISGEDVEAQVLAQCDADQLHLLLQRLPERDRTVLALRYWGDMSYAEIAAHMGLTEKNVSVILTRTTAKLRSSFEANAQAM